MAQQPPFKIPWNIKNGAQYRWVERKIPAITDGDRTKWPNHNVSYRTSTNEFYLCHLGQKWALKDGLGEAGVYYYIDKLPDGYAMFETNQYAGPQVYKRLFGHPTGRFFDSAIKFEAHFLWLMSEMSGDCECTLCGQRSIVPRLRNDYDISSKRLPERRARQSLLDDNDDDDDDNEDEDEDDGSTSAWSGSVRSVTPSIRQSRSRKRPRQQVFVDEEGNEDIYQDCIRRLYAARGSRNMISIDLEEKGSIDWRAERSCLPQYLTQLEQQHAFIPRKGELVLWCPTFPDDCDLMLDFSTLEYKFYSFTKGEFCGVPKWRAGVVATVPSSQARREAMDFSDLVEVGKMQFTLSDEGFRVETMPDPNDDLRKSLSKQYRYVPLRNMRPLAQWQLLIRGRVTDHLHESISYSLTCMTSISLLEKRKFLGSWPHGMILCRGIYLGAELIIVGDAVRIATQEEVVENKTTGCSTVLVITSIRYHLGDMSDEHASGSTSTIASSTWITFVGHAYTNNPQHAYQGGDDGISSATEFSGQQTPLPLSRVKEIFRSVGADAYGPWYPLHSAKQSLEVSHEKILGRLYEAEAVKIWTGERQIIGKAETSKPRLDFDVSGIVEGRIRATATDERLPEAENDASVNWYVADTRAQALALASLNDIELGRYQRVRDRETLKYWRTALNIADGRNIAPKLARNQVTISNEEIAKKRRGRPVGSKVVNGKLVLPGQMVRDTDAMAESREVLEASSQLAEAALVSEGEHSRETSGDFLYHNTNDAEGEEDFRG